MLDYGLCRSCHHGDNVMVVSLARRVLCVSVSAAQLALIRIGGVERPSVRIDTECLLVTGCGASVNFV